MFPVLYLLDDDGHATGTTYRFCSTSCRDHCREKTAEELDGPVREGDENLCPDGEICTWCCKPLEKTA